MGIEQNKLSRRKRRYMNRVSVRETKRREMTKDLDNYDVVFAFKNLWTSYKKSIASVRWKCSTQMTIANAPYNLNFIRKLVNDRLFKSTGFFEFDIFERGKMRHIRSVCMNERIVQRTICDYSLVPMFSRLFIYDNGASMKNKGIHFALNRLYCHLDRHYRKYGNDGYVLVYDFSKYFDTINHEHLFKVIRNCYHDEDLITLIKEFVIAFGDKGLGLGSQISQVLSLLAANGLDHYIKEVLGVKGYGRYMDDGYILSDSKEQLQNILKAINKKCGDIGIILNRKKTRIIPLHRGFTFLKVRVYLQKSGRILKKICRSSSTRMRHRLKKFRKRVDDGLMTMKDVCQSLQSWISHTSKTNSYKARKSMMKLFKELYKDKIYYIGGKMYVLQGA